LIRCNSKSSFLLHYYVNINKIKFVLIFGEIKKKLISIKIFASKANDSSKPLSEPPSSSKMARTTKAEKADKPKRAPRAPTAYNLFVKQFYIDYKEDASNEKLPPKEMIRLAAAAWKLVPDEEKAVQKEAAKTAAAEAKAAKLAAEAEASAEEEAEQEADAPADAPAEEEAEQEADAPAEEEAEQEADAPADAPAEEEA
jgi:hypothetical protein